MRKRLMVGAVILAAGLATAACGLGGPGGSAELAFAVDQADPDLPIVVAVEGPVPVGQQFFVRLVVNELVESDLVQIRILNDTGQGLQEIDFLEHRVEPPWTVAVVPVTINEPGKWSLSMVVNTRKITDVEVETVR
jgi:hypothetical protein